MAKYKRKYRFLSGGGTTTLFDTYNYTVKNTDICGTLTTNTSIGKCGVFLVLEYGKFNKNSKVEKHI